jgi:Tfp pilus assembly protein PilF
VSAALKSQERHVIPRWRDAHTTGALGELDPADAKPKSLGGDDFFEEKLTSWNHEHGFGFAADLVGSALVLGRFEEADEAARFIIEKKSEVGAAAQLIAARVLGVGEARILEEKPTLRPHRPLLIATIKSSRNRLREDPRNAIAWTDLARAYTSLGEDEKARRAMRMAITLAENNRFILRSASRLAIHLKEKDKGHDLLRRNRATRDDPWLLASEIAAADLIGRTSRFVKHGREILSAGNFAPFHLAELASAIGTLEMKAGNFKVARKLFQAALQNPTENSLAQIEWAAERLTGLVINQDKFKIPYSHEARALYSHAAADWPRAVNESVNWLSDEPFSSRPAVLGSFIASEHLENFEVAEQICRDGLIASPVDATLLNNLSFSLASKGDLEAAQATLDSISLSSATVSTEVCRDATQGLIAFRSGDYSLGRQNYERAIEKATAAGLTSLRIRAAIHFAREELRVDRARAAKILDDVLSLTKPSSDPDLDGVFRRLLDALNERRDPQGKLDNIMESVRDLLKPSRPPLSGTTVIL